MAAGRELVSARAHEAVRDFAREVYTLTEQGTIEGATSAFVEDELLSGLTDPAVIHEHLDRIARAVQGEDPAQAIGSTKKLIESTARVVLRERGLTLSARRRYRNW